MRQWFIDWDAESWGSTDEFDDAPFSPDDRAAVCEPPSGAAVSFLVSYLPSFSSLSTMFINIFRVFLLVAWWPFRITWKTLEILCHIIDALYDLIRFSLQRIRKLFVVLIFGMFFSVFLAPNFVYSIHSGNDYRDESLDLPDSYVRIFAVMVSYFWTGLITMIAYIVQAVSRRLSSNFSAFFIEFHNYPLLEDLSFRVFSVEEEVRESMRSACRVVRRVLDSGASTNLIANLLPGDKLMGEKTIRLALGKFESSTTTLFNDVYSSGVDEELISMGKFCYAGGKVDWHEERCSIFAPDTSGNLQFWFDLEIEKFCPVLTEQQALAIRRFQRTFSQKDNYLLKKTATVSDPIPTSVLIFHEYSPSFEHFYDRGDFSVEAMDFMSTRDPAEIFDGWKQSATPNQFLLFLATLARGAFERGGDLSHGSTNPFEAEKEDAIARNFSFFRQESLGAVNIQNRKSPQKKTSFKDKRDFYEKLGSSWCIFGDVHFSSHTSFDGCKYIWCYHCSRFVKETKTIQVVEITFPVEASTAESACKGLRFCLEQLGEWAERVEGRKTFFFESETENVCDSEEFQSFLLSLKGSHHMSVPYRHPGKEATVRNCLERTRAQLNTSNLPITAWSSITRAITQSKVHEAKLLTEVYKNKTFDKGYLPEYVGRICNVGSVHLPGATRSLNSKVVPAILLDSAARNRVHVIHATGTALGYRYTQVEYDNVEITDTWAFGKEMHDLKIRRYMQHPFESKLVAKPNKVLPRKLSCKRCIRLDGKPDIGPDAESGQRQRGHTCDQGCNYQCMDCFSQDIEFSVDPNPTDPFSKLFFDPDVGNIERFCSHSEPSGENILHFGRAVQDIENDGLAHFRFLTQHFKENPRLKDILLPHKGQQSTAEEAATYLFLSSVSTRDGVKRAVNSRRAQREKQHGRQHTQCPITNRDRKVGEHFYAVVVANSVVQKAEGKELASWLEGADQEIGNLVKRGVLQLVHASELDRLQPGTFEVIPSLCVWSLKADGTHKARLVACGNFQTLPDNEGITGNFAGTTSLSAWRSCLTIFVQARGSAACLDVKEAFTQSSEDGERLKQTFLRLPSQWKRRLLPHFLYSQGVTHETFADYVLAVLKSIYGESSAPKRWKETFSKLLRSLGFSESEYEEGLFFRVNTQGVLSVVSTYVDDVWIFSLCEDEMAEIVSQISEAVTCTLAKILCGAPAWFHEKHDDLTEAQKKILKAFEFPKHKTWQVAKEDNRIQYVGIDIYFKDDDLILDSQEFIEKSVEKLMDKNVITEVKDIYSLKSEEFNHLRLFQDVPENPLLTPEERTHLRAGVNTLAYCGLSTCYYLQAPLGSVARGQSNGRRRHLQALQTLISYAYHKRNLHLCIPVPTWLPKVRNVSGLRIISETDWDSSLGNTNAALGVDAHARHGFVAKLGLHENALGVVWARSSLQTTISMSTCESELTACSYCSRNILGLINVLTEVFPGAEILVPRLRGDNAAANLIAANQAGLRSHRHLSLAQIWVRTLTREGRVKIYSVGTKENTSDLLTKVTTENVTTHLLHLLNYKT